MDAYEATKIVYQRIQTLDPENASKIMGILLIQDHGEKEMIRLAFGPESSIHSVILKAKKDLCLATSSSSSSSSPNSPCSSPLSLSRQNSSCRLPSPLSISTTNNHSPNPWANDVISANANSPSTMNPAADPFYSSSDVVDLIDELQLQDQLSFLNEGGNENDGLWGGHRRSCSVSDIISGGGGGDEGFGWKPCLYYARGYCKNGTTCRFLHGGENGDNGGQVVGSPSKLDLMEQELLMRSKSQRLNAAAAQLMASNSFPYSKQCLNFLQQQFPANESPRFSKARMERGEFGLNCLNPGSRQIYLTFPADSTFKEEDVSNYFSIFGPVQDVRIPYQQKRMFGFVTFEFPETVKLILAKGNPHFVCDARVLVKPYKEKGKIPEKHRRQGQQMERADYPGCGSPTGMDSRDPFDLQLGARMFYNTQDMLWRRKFEEQADLQQAIELQNRRLMGLQLLDVKRNNHHRALSTGAVMSSPTYSPTYYNRNAVFSGGRNSPEAKEENVTMANLANHVGCEEDVIEKEKDAPFIKADNANGKRSPPKESDFQESSEHNLPDSPFASPKASGDYFSAFSNDSFEAENNSQPSSTSSNGLITGSSLFNGSSSPSIDMAPFKSCYFQAPRFSSGHETIGM